jgi:4-diphosphocytidyl-2-C-methyl-D-erythritol kinase
MQIHRTSVEVVIQTPAKLNLSFEVLARRTDGYHEIESLMCPISLYDTLSFAPTDDSRLHFDCRWGSNVGKSTACGFAEVPQDASNLVVKAVDLLRQTTGERRGAVVQLTKRIPTAAGLGGGSSDAAAALVAANLAWNCHLTTAELMGLAAQLGSDVPFFLAGAAAICRGRGEQIEPLDGLSGLNFVVVRPPEGLSTATVYRNCDISDCINADGLHTMTGLVEDLRRGDLSRAGKMFFNRLQSAAEKLSDWIKRLSDLFAAHSCLGHAMSGSGTSYFGLVATAAQARRLAGRLRSMGMGSAFVVRTC